ncbi:MAG TPA: DUF438 domain-containing protein [Atopostipes sp.]|nr:DUF438 domain-containing protein [Atopostipes sp.]
MQDRGAITNERQERLKNLILRLHEGESEEVIKEEFKEHFETVSPLEISVMERKLMKEEGLSAENIMKLCNVHVAVMADFVSDPENIPDDFSRPGHPVYVLKEENLALEAALMRIRNLLEVYIEAPSDEIKAGLRKQIDLLWDFDKHYTRKEMSFFPIMERQGNTAPPQVMWGVDDQIRDQYKAFKAAFLVDEMDQLMPLFSELEYEMQEMFVKEESILIPMVTEAFNEDDWIAIADEMDEIGYCIVEPLEKWKPVRQKEEVDINEEAKGRLKLGTGSLSHKELDLILNKLPLEITFVDKDHIVKYYDNGPEEKLLARTPSAIGRDMLNCHPPRVHETVKQLVHDLETGVKDSQQAWYKRDDGVFVFIDYIAIRDEEGSFLGILETVQDISKFTKLDSDNRRVNN